MDLVETFMSMKINVLLTSQDILFPPMRWVTKTVHPSAAAPATFVKLENHGSKHAKLNEWNFAHDVRRKVLPNRTGKLTDTKKNN